MTDRQTADAGFRFPAPEQRFLVAALLCLVARGDGEIADIESARMIGLLSEHLGLDSAAALASLQAVLNALQDDEDLLVKLQAVARLLTESERREILTMMLSVAAADGLERPEELATIHCLAADVLQLDSAAIAAERGTMG